MRSQPYSCVVMCNTSQIPTGNFSDMNPKQCINEPVWEPKSRIEKKNVCRNGISRVNFSKYTQNRPSIAQSDIICTYGVVDSTLIARLHWRFSRRFRKVLSIQISAKSLVDILFFSFGTTAHCGTRLSGREPNQRNEYTAVSLLRKLESAISSKTTEKEGNTEHILIVTAQVIIARDSSIIISINYAAEEEK